MKKYFFILLVIGVAALPVEAEGFFSRLSWFGEGSILFFLEDNDVADSAPMPILPSLGAGASYPFADTLRLELTLDFYTTHYHFHSGLNRPVPVEIENRTARVLGFILGFQAVRPFNVTPDLTLRAYGGLAADIRIVFAAAGLEAHEDMREIHRNTRQVRRYFWSQGRWLLPVIGLGADYTLNSGLKLGFDFRVWMPADRLWTGEDLPAVEGWRFGPGIRLTFR